ncbi:MAG: peptidase [Paracoccaceae bacterium]
MVDGATVVQAARGWIGTPYLHQASLRGAGTDCLGLLRGVWRELCGDEPLAVPPYSPDWSEVSGIETLLGAAQACLIQVPLFAHDVGDVLLFRMRDGAVAKHLGIAAQVDQYPTFVHAFTGHGVVESPFSDPWQRRVVGRFRFP